VVVGTSHETPAFAVAAIRRWWLVVGRRRSPEARRLLILADSGGERLPEVGLEGGVAAPGGRVRGDRHGVA
jgi:hypothetical protein